MDCSPSSFNSSIANHYFLEFSYEKGTSQSIVGVANTPIYKFTPLEAGNLLVRLSIGETPLNSSADALSVSSQTVEVFPSSGAFSICV